MRTGIAVGVALVLATGTFVWAALGVQSMMPNCPMGRALTPAAAASATAPASQPTTQSSLYVCPMHSDVTSDKPGKCPKCGMDLVKKSDAPKAESSCGSSCNHEH